MRFDTSQHMRLNQQMKLAPRMIHSMEILQMPMMALQERIDQELESNIALELVEPGSESQQSADERQDDEREESLGERDLVVGENAKTETDDWRRLSELESSYGDAFDNEYSSHTYSPRRADGERDKKLDAMANLSARPESLTEQLLHQWSFAEVDLAVAEAGRRLIPYIDDDGLLSADLQTILEQTRNLPQSGSPDSEPITMELLESALREVQKRLDPPGIAGRDRRECLLLQIDRFEAEPGHAEDWSDVRLLIKDHYDDLLQNRLPKIVARTGWPMKRIQDAMALMRKLNLSPARALINDEVPPIIPDVVVEYDEESDAYVARLSDGTVPRLRISKQYEKMARDRAIPKETRQFVSDNVRNASWLIDAINQRKATLLRVVNVVLTRQREYFDHGAQFLKPLPMIEVADQLGIHVGTVSRAVADKWMQTPRGMVALRKFFSGGTETESGRDMSWDAVKAILKEIVDNEDKTKPLSDEALAAELKKRGIDIARRTVVKYRQQMDIPPARQRRVFTE